MTHQGSPTAGRRGTGGDDGMNQGMRVLSLLIAGVLLYGGLGWVGDHFLGTKFLLPIGIVLGAGFGIYTTIKRLGAAEAATGTTGSDATAARRTSSDDPAAAGASSAKTTEGER